MILKNYRQVFGSCPKNTIFAVILLTKNNQLMDLGAFGAFGALFGLVLIKSPYVDGRGEKQEKLNNRAMIHWFQEKYCD